MDDHAYANQRWSFDFVIDALADGQRFLSHRTHP